MIITSNNASNILELKQFLYQHFQIKYLGSLNCFLGLEVTSTSYGYYLTQAKYFSDILSLADLTDCKRTDNLLESNVKLRATD